MNFKKHILNKALALALMGGFSLVSFLAPNANAAVGILPGGGEVESGYTDASTLSANDCYNAVDQWDEQYSVSGYNGVKTEITTTDGKKLSSEEMLACALKSGNMSFWMVPYFVNYALEYAINVAGIIVVLMIVVGGYYYIYGAVTDDKEKGKTIITYAIGGYALVLVSWFIVNALLLAVTQ